MVIMWSMQQVFGIFQFSTNRISGVMVSVLVSSAVHHGFQLRWGQTKDYKIGICCFSAKYAALRRKSKDGLAQNQDNVSEWGDISIRRLLFHWASSIIIQLSTLVWYKVDLIIFSFKNWLVGTMRDMKNCWVGIKQQSLTHSIFNYTCKYFTFHETFLMFL